jgi:Acetyltransferase (GNAT) domain
VELYSTDPLSDRRWDDLVARHPRASVFHERGWLEALRRTYGYEPFVLTSTPSGKPLSDGVVLCRVSSWITGARAVSLPFADHCEPLLNGTGECPEFASWLRAECDRQHWKYVELRPLSWDEAADCPLRSSRSYCFHTLDLTPTLEEIFRGLHKDSMQRRIRRAEREGLSYEAGSKALLDEFYHLVLVTRRRHRLLPQPHAWFRNLIDCMGDKVQIRLARKNCLPIAAIMTLRHRSTVVYKYGCSDDKFHNLAGMPFLFWKLIEESQASGTTAIDFGRSDLDQAGLIAFKDRLGANKRQITYFRYPQRNQGEMAAGWKARAMRQISSILPDAGLSAAGRVLYRHMG